VSRAVNTARHAGGNKIANFTKGAGERRCNPMSIERSVTRADNADGFFTQQMEMFDDK